MNTTGGEMTVEEIVRMIAPAIMRRRISRGLRWLQNPSGHTVHSDTFLVAHGFMTDEISPAPVLAGLWEEAQRPSLMRFRHSNF